MNKPGWILTLVLIAMGGEAQAARQGTGDGLAGTVVERGKWLAGCNNLRSCTAIATVRGNIPGDDSGHVRFIFGAQIADAQTVEIVRSTGEIERLSPLAAQYLTQALLAAPTGTATHSGSNGIQYEIPREGFRKVAALLDKWRKGLPADPRPPAVTVTPLPAPLIHDIGTPALLANASELCPDGHMGDSLQAWRGFAGRFLWRVGCGDEGLNPQSLWYLAGPQGAPPEPVTFPDGESAVTAHNSWFDGNSGILRMTHYFGGHLIYRHEDCGIYRAYGWGLDGMQLIERRYMPVCGTGIDKQDWIVTYRADLFNAPDSGP